MKDLKVFIDCTILTLTVYLACPILIFGLLSTDIASVSLFLIYPIVCLVCGAFCGGKNGIQLHYPICAAVMFIPIMLLFFDSSIWYFILIYFGFALGGIFLGYLYVFSAKNHKNKKLMK